ncbi:hypothetical protein BGW41_007623 [Actinomortierella wolfii]|nr:hypothetical protein BGW41_007623 [Actinomortierella wolfii]
MGYSEAFLTERPQDGLDAVQARLRKGKALHEQLANYFKERAHIEDMYAKSITKAFQKHFVTDPSILGTFISPWERLSEETTELATLHGQLSLRILNEIEKPLRDYARLQPAWQNLTLAESNCARLAKEYDEKLVKVTKYTKTVERVTSGKKAEVAEQKLMGYTKQLESTRTAWRLEGPVILQKYQDVDEGRLAHLKDMITAFEALQTEIALQVVEMASKTSASVAEFEPMVDMELFASEAAMSMRTVQPASLSTREGSTLSSSTHPHDEMQQQHIQSSSNHSDTVSSLEPRKSNGTHRRGMTSGSQMSNTSFSTDISHGLSKVASIEHIRGHFGASDQGQILNNTRAQGSTLDVPTLSQRVDAEGYSIPPPDNSPWAEAAAAAAAAGGGGTGSVLGDDEKSETSSFFSHMTPNRMQMEIRQDSVSENTEEAKAAMERVASTLKATNTVSRRARGRREIRSMYHASEDSLAAYSSNPSHQSSPGGTSVGFSGQTPESSPSASRIMLNSQGGGGSASGGVPSLANSTAFSPHNLRASTIGFSTSASSSPLTPTFPPAVRASTLGVPSLESPTSSSPSSTNPFLQPPLPTSSNTTTTASTTATTVIVLNEGQPLAAEPDSIHDVVVTPPPLPELQPVEGAKAVDASATTTATATTDATDNIAAVSTQDGQGEVGLSEVGASVVERINLLSHGGEIAKMMVTGEVSLHLDRFLAQQNPKARKGRLVLRLRRTDELDKYLPNPNFLAATEASSSSEEEVHEQEYQLDVDALRAARQAGQMTVVVLKYQVKTEDGNQQPQGVPRQQQMVPLLMQPAWKIEPHQTSLLINYKTNARCRLATALSSSPNGTTAPAQLSDVSFLVPVAGKVTNVQSRPNGVWSDEANKMLWDIGTMALDEHPEPHKLLARFELDPNQAAGPEGSQNGPAAVKFRIHGRLLSAIEVDLTHEKASPEGDEDGDGQVEVEEIRVDAVQMQTQSGRYLAMA